MGKIIKKILGFIFEKCFMIFVSYMNSVVLEKVAKYGRNSAIVYPYNILGFNNIYIGDEVHIGAGSTLFSTRAKLIIKNHVIFGPNVSIITGDHMSIPGKFMSDIKDEDKSPEFDQDVMIDTDVWVGSNVTILKGVKIGRGSIVASGSVVTKDVFPYSIVGGVPAKLIKFKWNKNEILFHEQQLFSDRTDFINEMNYEINFSQYNSN